MVIQKRGIFQTLLNEPFTFLGGLLFFLMMFSPAYNVVPKVILICILLITVFISRIIFDKLNVTKEVLLWYILFIGHGIFFTILGLLYHNNTSFVLRTTTYNIVWPAFYLVFTIGLYKRTSLSFLGRIIILSNLLISLYIIGSTLTNLGFLPPLPFITFEMAKLGRDTLQGLLKAEAPSVVCLLFTVPFVLAVALVDSKKTFGFGKFFVNISLLVSIIAVIATVRRALIVNIFLGFIFTLIFSRRTRSSLKKLIQKNSRQMIIIGGVLLFAVFLVIQNIGFMDMLLVYEKFTSAFEGSNTSDVSTSIRYDQFNLLIKSWLSVPFLGHGHGAVSPYIVRSERNPWVYELSYVALLYQTGIIGLSVYIYLLGWPIVKGFLLLKRTTEEIAVFIIPSIVGCACFLIANATNPYLISYDYMWTLFFPVAIVNYAIKEANKTHA